jgi:ATP/maltotriose-dependent transcriptional regulator MalT
VLQHSALDRETGEQAKQCLLLCENKLSSEQLATATRKGATADLESVVTELQVDLAQPLPSSTGPDQPVATVPAANDQLVEPLTPREMEVLRLIAKGLTNQQIADQLIIAIGTVKSYTAEIYGKLQVNNRTQAVTRAQDINLLD